jgi:sulfonate transport system ATP-binding protein
MTENALQITDLSRSFKVDGHSVDALTDVDLSVKPGEFITIVGASGCGKSTLLRLIAGLDVPDKGTIIHDGQTIEGPSLKRGIVFQEPRLFPWLTVSENIALGLENAPVAPDVKAHLVHQHIALNRPDVLLLDEPFGALDALTRAHLQSELQRIWSHERITMLLVTHDVDEAVFLGDRVVVMAPRPGRIAEIFDIALPHPRDRKNEGLLRLRNRVLTALEATAPLDHVHPGGAVSTDATLDALPKEPAIRPRPTPAYLS